MKQEMKWFALVSPHPDCKSLVIPCDDDLFEVRNTIKEYMNDMDGSAFIVRFARHRADWIKQFKEI